MEARLKAEIDGYIRWLRQIKPGWTDEQIYASASKKFRVKLGHSKESDAVDIKVTIEDKTFNLTEMDYRNLYSLEKANGYEGRSRAKTDTIKFLVEKFPG